MVDTVNMDRLEKDVTAVKGDISALTRQISDVMNSLAGTARKEAHKAYKQARAAAEDAFGDLSERSSAMMDAARMPPPRSRRRWRTPSCSVRSRPWALRSVSAS